eukprot:CAMPEP_0172822142 /NCGR_PEP_ID=MMETSP1075-20121228/16476_1 /TAXON_ID=2916 /ORGANISM="Ceratium fusus, Strain PA161109" /LENGTH=58 /DNA_ID=CAMNT_0013663095 /DNA_START=269 /DNA_END=442 /DNA_ORIENTATION=+
MGDPKAFAHRDDLAQTSISTINKLNAAPQCCMAAARAARQTVSCQTPTTAAGKKEVAW